MMSELFVTSEILPSSFKNEIVKSNADSTIIRTNLKNMDDLNKWVKDFAAKTNTRWNVRHSNPNGKKFVCMKKFVCHHSVYHKAVRSSKKSKCANCEASIFVKIKLNSTRVKNVDPYVKRGLCGVITIQNKHSHSLMTAETLRFLPADEDIKDKYFEYFSLGMGVAESWHYHKSVLESQEGVSEVELASGALNPSQRTVRYWYDLWQQLKLGPKNDQGLIEDDQLFEKGERMIPRKDKILSSKNMICELHTEKECIATDTVTKKHDGSLSKIPKRHVLKESSVPTIFQNSPSYVYVQTKKRKAPTPQQCFSSKKVIKLESEESSELDIPKPSSDFAKLSIEIKNISMPNSWWSLACTDNYILFAKWNSKFWAERRVVIGKDLSIKIFLMKVEVSLSIEKCTMEKISQLLQTVDNFNMCENADSETSSGCLGFIESKRRLLCSACYKSNTIKDNSPRR